MLKLSVVVSALLTAGSVHAQFTILSDTRSVSVSGWVEDTGGNVTQSFSQSQTQSGTTFPSFTGSAGGNANGLFGNSVIFSASSALQYSSVTSTQLSYSGSVGAFQSYPAPFGRLYADAASLFTVSFSVSSATLFSLTDNQHNWDFPDASESLTLSSSSGGNILAGPQFNPSGSGTDEYSGVLEPDQTYTLQVSLKTQDLSNPSVAQAFDVMLSAPSVLSVPEPSSSLLLGMGAAMAGVLVFWRKHSGPALSKLHCLRTSTVAKAGVAVCPTVRRKQIRFK